MTFDASRPPAQVPPPTTRLEAFTPVAPEPCDPATLEVPVPPVRSTAGSGRVLNRASLDLNGSGGVRFGTAADVTVLP